MSINLTPDIGENFCYAPWTNIHISTIGQYKTCCAGTSTLGTLTGDINYSLLTEIKTALINNQPHSNCNICIKSEEHSPNNERNWYNIIANRKVIPINTINDQYLQNLDVRWNNTCNLSCVYCGADASSLWAQKTKQSVPQENKEQNVIDIVNRIRLNKSTIKNVALLGGEPLLQKENELLLDALDSNVHINIITNLSVPLEKNKIFNQLLNKDNVMWDVSFETVGNRFEYVRHGASWTLMIKNLRLLQEAIKDKPMHNINITGQFSVYNCLNLSEVLEYLLDNNLPIMKLNELIYPSVLSVFSLPNHLLIKASHETAKSIKYFEYFNLPTQIDFLNKQTKHLQETNNPTANVNALYKWHADQEQKFWPDSTLKFSELWPEFKQDTP